MIRINLLPTIHSTKIYALQRAASNYALAGIPGDLSESFLICSSIKIPEDCFRIIPGSLRANKLGELLMHPYPFPNSGFTRLNLLSNEEFNKLGQEVRRLNNMTLYDLQAEHQDIPREMLTNKLARVYLIERYWTDHGLATATSSRHEQKDALSLFDYAIKEWIIIYGLATARPIPTEVLGVPSNQTAETLSVLNRRILMLIFCAVNEPVLHFMTYFLLLHDLGKLNLGETGHEQRSESIARVLLNDKAFSLSDKEKRLMIRMIGFHSGIDLIISPDYGKAENAKRKLSHIFRDTKLSIHESKGILQAWLLFRIAERTQSEHFGFIDEQYINDILITYRTVIDIISK